MSVKFPIRPVNTGMVDVEVLIKSYRAGDGVRKQLLVEVSVNVHTHKQPSTNTNELASTHEHTCTQANEHPQAHKQASIHNHTRA